MRTWLHRNPSVVVVLLILLMYTYALVHRLNAVRDGADPWWGQALYYFSQAYLAWNVRTWWLRT